MLCISVAALCKPQGTEGRADWTPSRKESLSRIERSDELLKGGWFFFSTFPAHCFFLHHQLKTPSSKILLAYFFFKRLSQSFYLFLFTLRLCTQPFPHVFPLCLPGWEACGECGQHGSGGADMPAFHHPALTEDGFHALSI